MITKRQYSRLQKVGYQQMKWVTWDGKDATMQTISHQHLSNAYWFMIIINKMDDPNFIEAVFQTLRNRFDGKLLQYTPDPNFKQETELLRKENYLMLDGTIWCNGELVGDINPDKGWFYVI